MADGNLCIKLENIQYSGAVGNQTSSIFLIRINDKIKSCGVWFLNKLKITTLTMRRRALMRSLAECDRL